MKKVVSINEANTALSKGRPVILVVGGSEIRIKTSWPTVENAIRFLVGDEPPEKILVEE